MGISISITMQNKKAFQFKANRWLANRCMNKFDGPYVVGGSHVNKFEQVLGSQVTSLKRYERGRPPCEQIDWQTDLTENITFP